MCTCQWRSEGGGRWWGLNPPWIEQIFFYHVIWITVVFRSNDSRCLLWKFSAIRVTRWLLWHPNCIKFNFGWGSVPNPAGGAYDAPPDLLVGWGGETLSPFPTPLDDFGVSLSMPSASNPRHLRRLDSNPLLRISGYATGTCTPLLSGYACEFHSPELPLDVRPGHSLLSGGSRSSERGITVCCNLY